MIEMRPWFKKVLGAAAISLWVLSLGCERKKPDGDKLLRLGYFANLTHAQALLGVASGDFERAIAPAKLSTNIFNAGPSLIEAILAGEIDMGYIGPGPAINAHTRTYGQGIRAVAGAAANGVVIVVAKDSGIENLEDLKGKRIATPQLGNTQDISARRYLAVELGQTSLENVLPIPNGEQAAMMLRGQIDAAWAVEPWGTRIVADAGARILTEEKTLWPDRQFGLTIVITTPEFLAQHPRTVRKLLEAHKAWTEKLAADPAPYVPQLGQALLDLTGKGVPEPLIAEALSRVKFTTDPMETSLATFAQWAYDLKFLNRAPDLRGLVDTTLLEELK